MDIKGYIENIPMWADKKNSLMDIREYLSIMGCADLNLKSKIIHIAGTNGKGSVCAYLTKILCDKGYTVGTFISPHLVDINERILLNNCPIDDNSFENTGILIKEISEKMVEKKYNPPTYFEFLFYMAIKYFYEQEPDYIILETGLGGRLDVTNSLERVAISIITSISMDHMQYLGNTIEDIAYEKAGIVKNAPLIFDDSNPIVKDILIKTANSLGIDIFLLSDIKKANLNLSFLNAEYKKDNALLAIYAMKILGFDIENAPDGILNSIKNTVWKGRMQEIYKDVFLDGAHNADGIDACLSAIESIKIQRKKEIKLLISFVSDKDFKLMLKKIENFSKKNRIVEICIAKLDTYRAIDTSVLKYILTDFGFNTKEFSNVSEAFNYITNNKRGNELIFCIGSLYLVGEILGGIK